MAAVGETLIAFYPAEDKLDLNDNFSDSRSKVTSVQLPLLYEFIQEICFRE